MSQITTIASQAHSEDFEELSYNLTLNFKEPKASTLPPDLTSRWAKKPERIPIRSIKPNPPNLNQRLSADNSTRDQTQIQFATRITSCEVLWVDCSFEGSLEFNQRSTCRTAIRIATESMKGNAGGISSNAMVFWLELWFSNSHEPWNHPNPNHLTLQFLLPVKHRNIMRHPSQCFFLYITHSLTQPLTHSPPCCCQDLYPA